MSGENDDAILGHLRLVLNEDRAAIGQIAHDVPVVDDLLTDVHRGAEVVERPLDGIDRPVYSGAVSAR
jgi:hypothetical protein